jgi:hypothetical protein
MPPTPDFSHYKKATVVVAEQTITIKLFELDRDNPPELYCRNATEINREYFNARLAAEASDPAYIAAARGVTTADTPAASRRIDAKLFPELVVTGWGKVVDAAGAVVPYSTDGCVALLANLGHWSFDQVRAQCKDPKNFTQGALDAATVAKN